MTASSIAFPRSWAERVIPAIGLMAAAVAGLMPTRTVAQPVITEFLLPTAGSNPFGITAGPDGNLWFTESNANANRIGRITPGGVITEFVPTAFSQPFGITVGPDGNLWFTERSGNRIGRITPGGVITEFPVPTAGSGPFGITAGPDGNLWFAEENGNRIGRITPGGVITEFPVPTAFSNPIGITAGPDGNLWFTERSGNRIGRITPAGVITEFPVPTASSEPTGITAGPDGNLWFTEFNANRIGRITPGGGPPVDDDGDGVPNGADQCPGTPAGQAVNASGCALSQLSFVLTVTPEGASGVAALGMITSDQAGIACGADCTETYPGGTQVTLRAATQKGVGFAGFSGGGCSGPGACVVTLAADTTVTATFSPPPDRPAITLPVEDKVTIAAGGALPITWTPTPGAAQHGLEFAGQNLPFANPGGAGPDGVNGFGGAGGGFPLGAGTSTNLAVPPGTPAGAYKVRIVGLSPAFIPVGKFSDAITLLIGGTGAGQPAFTAPAGGTVLRRGDLVTFTWSGVAGATRYLFDFEGGPDSGRLGGNLIVTGTSLPALVPTTVPGGSYRVRVLGLSATGAPVGTFSDPLDLTIQP